VDAKNSNKTSPGSSNVSSSNLRRSLSLPPTSHRRLQSRFTRANHSPTSLVFGHRFFTHPTNKKKRCMSLFGNDKSVADATVSSFANKLESVINKYNEIKRNRLFDSDETLLLDPILRDIVQTKKPLMASEYDGKCFPRTQASGYTSFLDTIKDFVRDDEVVLYAGDQVIRIKNPHKILNTIAADPGSLKRTDSALVKSFNNIGRQIGSRQGSNMNRFYQEPKVIDRNALPLGLQYCHDIHANTVTDYSATTLGSVGNSSRLYFSQFGHRDYDFGTRDLDNDPLKEDEVIYIVFHGIMPNGYLWILANGRWERVSIPYGGTLVIRSDTIHAGFWHNYDHIRLQSIVSKRKYAGQKSIGPVYTDDKALQPLIFDLIANRLVQCEFREEDKLYSTKAKVHSTFLNEFVSERKVLLDLCENYYKSVLGIQQIGNSGTSCLHYSENLENVDARLDDCKSMIETLERNFYNAFTEGTAIAARQIHYDQAVRPGTSTADLEVLVAQYDEYLECGSQEGHGDPDAIITPVPEDESHVNTLMQSFESRNYTMSEGAITRVKRVLSIAEDDRLLFEKFGIPMTSGKLKCLQNHSWLNDEVINMYCLLLRDRDNARCEVHAGRLRSWVFSSCFMDKLRNLNDKKDPGYCYNNVMRYKMFCFLFDLIK
jgi:hypothetical protein